MASINAKDLRKAIKQQFQASRRRWLSAMDSAWYDIAKGVVKHLTAPNDASLYLSSTGEWTRPVPDPSSADEIEAALASRGSVSLNSRAVIEITRPIVLPDNCVIEGNGAEIRCMGDDFPAFIARDVEVVRLRNLVITRPGFATLGGDGIVIQGVKNLILDGCEVRDHFTQINIKDCVSPVPDIIQAGTPGTTKYAYVVVAVLDGVRMEIDAAGATLTGNSTLSAFNYNTIQWADLLTPEYDDTHTYEVYRTVGGVTQGLIGTVDAGVRTFDDTGIAATAACPASPRFSPMTNAVPQGTPGSTPRKYAVVAVIDGVRWANYDVVTEAFGNATLTSTDHTIVAWSRVLGRAKVSEAYEVYRIQGGGLTGDDVGLIGTVTAIDRLNDVGQAATDDVVAIPRATRNQRVTIKDTWAYHSAATGLNNQYHLQVNSCMYLDISHSHFGADRDSRSGGAWLDGVKLRARVYSIKWHGGSANYNGKSLNDGASGDGLDGAFGAFYIDLDSVDFIGNSANGVTDKTVGWWHAGQIGNPETGIPNGRTYRRLRCQYNHGAGLQLDGIEDSQLVSGEDIVRPRVAFVKVTDSFLDYNGLWGTQLNARSVTFNNTTFRGNYREGANVDKQASDCWFMRCDFYGNGVEGYTAIQCLAPASMADSDFITVVTGGGATALYEFDTLGNGVTPGRTQVNISGASSAEDVAVILTAAINTAQPNVVAGVRGSVVIVTRGVLTVLESVANAGFTCTATTYPDVTINGAIQIKTLAGDLAAGATSFSIPDATGVPASGRVSFGRRVAGVVPAATLEVYDYKRVGTTVTLFTEYPGSGVVASATVFNHFIAAGANARDVGFADGARKIHFFACNFVGTETNDLTEVSLDGDLNGAPVMTRNHVEIYDGADEIELLDCKTRYVSSDPYGSPYVPILPTDTCFTARVLLRHTDPFHATPTNRYYGGIGSEYITTKAAMSGSSSVGVTKFCKESGLANTRTGWVARA